MIRINLLPQKKVTRADKGQQMILLALLILIMGGVGVYFFVHKKVADKISDVKATNANLRSANNRIQQKLKDEPKITAAEKAKAEREEAVAQLEGAAATPAYMLNELSRILTPDTSPTMTDAMTTKVNESLLKELDPEWDPKDVWVTAFEEKQGEFTLTGGAENDTAMTELAKRLEASVFFANVIPEGGKTEDDKASGVKYFKFTITGRVVY